MILRVVREDQAGALTVETREFLDSCLGADAGAPFLEALSDEGTLQGVVGASMAEGDGLDGDWLMRSDWSLESSAVIGQLLGQEVERSIRYRTPIQRLFVWIPTDDAERTRTVLWLLSGGELWPGGTPSSSAPSLYPYDATLGKAAPRAEESKAHPAESAGEPRPPATQGTLFAEEGDPV